MLPLLALTTEHVLNRSTAIYVNVLRDLLEPIVKLVGNNRRLHNYGGSQERC